MKKYISISEKFFVAGANGMAGKSICRSLIKNGYCSDVSGGKLLAPKKEELNLLHSENVHRWFKENKPTVVIIAAAKVGGILANLKYPTDFLLENLKIQSNIIEAAYLNDTKRLLFLGSSCIYPKFASQPIKEEYLLSSKLEETNEPYAIAKITGIKLCEALTKQYGFDAISLMPTNLYGPGDNYSQNSSHVLPAMIRRFSYAKKNSLKSVDCWGSGNPLREFMYVDDLGDGVVFALENWSPKSENAPLDKNGSPLLFLNIGTGNEISIKNLAEKIAEIYKFEGVINWDIEKPDGTPRKLLNIERIKNLGWEPKVSLENGLKNTINFFEKEFTFL